MAKVWSLLIIFQFSLFLPLACSETTQTGTFHITGLFPIDADDLQTRNTLGVYPRAAASYAVEQINALGLLDSHNMSLSLQSFSSSCGGPASGAHGLIQTLEFAKKRGIYDTSGGSQYAILGQACSSEATLSESLTSNYLRVVQVSYGSDTPLLSDIDDFSMFYRTVPSYLSYLDSVGAVMEYFDWQLVAVIHEETPFYTVALEMFDSYLSSSDTLPRASVIDSQGLSSFLDLDRTLGSARIFVVMAPENMAALVLCSAFHLGLTGPQYQWILLGDFDDRWWKQSTTPSPSQAGRLQASCSEEVMLRAIESTFILTYSSMTQSLTGEIVSGQTMSEFWSDFTRYFMATENKEFIPDHSRRVASTYDAVWSIALALNTSLTNYSDQRNVFSTNYSTSDQINISEPQETVGEDVRISELLNSAMETLDFQGASGRTLFTANQHSILPSVTRLSQMQNGSTVFIGVHDKRDSNVLNLTGSLSWQSASGPPRDRPSIRNETVDIYLVAIMLLVVSLGIILCIVLAAINCYYRKHKVIKASSPYINILIISGCFLGFLSVIFISIENIDAHLTIAPEAYILLCNARPWLLSIGYTLAFGALFAKTWRIYCIFRNPWKRNRPLKDYILIGIVCILVSVDVVILVLWLVLDPLNLNTYIVDTDEETFSQELHLICSAEPDDSLSGFTLWIVTLMSLKGFLLLFGAFLVSRTGKIKAEFFQDAKYTGIAIYGVGVVCAVGVPVALILMYNYVEDPGYIIATATISFCSYLILFMVFIPKIILLKKYKKKVPTAILIGLNPSFRVRSRSKYLGNKKRPYQQVNSWRDSTVTQGRESVTSNCTILTSVTDSEEQVASTDLKKEEDFNDQLLTGWEASWESSVEADDVELSLKVQETEISFEDISYIASIVIENRLESESSYSIDSGRVVQSVIEGGASHMTTGDVDRPVSPPTLETTKSTFSIDYTTVCVAEVHPNSASDSGIPT